MRETLYFYFTSDLHSHFDNWPKIMNEINQNIKKHEHNQEFYMLLDNGDHMDRSHLITEATLGEGNIELLNHSGFDVATLGNNEGITLPEEKLYHLYDHAEFEVVCANVKPQQKTEPHWLKQYQIFETPSGIKIGVIGLTAPFQAFYEKLGWEASDPLAALEKWLPDLQKQSDVIIVLSHLGISKDELMAEEYDVDVIIGGHTHHLFKQGQIINDTIITAVGKHGFYYGAVTVDVEIETRKRVGLDGYAVSVAEEEDHPETAKVLSQLNDEANDKLRKVITNLSEPYPVDWLNETSLMKAFVKTLKHWTKADCALLNSGVLLHGFNEGPVTRKDVHESCPHPMNPCTMKLTGRELIETVRMLEQEQFIHFELKGLGFRGKKIGKMVYENLSIEYHDDTNYVETVYVNGHPVQPNAAYVVATADTFSFPQLVPPISSVKEKQYYLPEFLRDLLEECLTTLK
ncbi:bifunctional metallophosphatase/5'-nucleotidase [Aquisalibacillus elongatus]|uniref:2',3'-cyclic-nucleotide 2'-phosphodiesterase (5'-nucleotidase family) n=1 Tax=Aquisalibacillus elongatus TaxID=485577 RepID=A0A3N5C2D7_9BACI|nr:bifunctional UDP-sugar hydrolase/5'-nucleotidase [Aquisalibacillus elongatus]RPF50341.1 2',3'-cyclic-nucleotide 2'-phosphodiesterase (5'-nucleotidase family) [Aquisalibacillus elongatus]